MKQSINFPEPYQAQIPIIQSCIAPSSVKTIVVNGGRQVGKSWILCVVGFYWAMEEPNQHIMIISPTDRQVGKLYDDMLAMIGENTKQLVTRSKGSSGDYSLKLINGSKILFLSSGAGDAIRGNSNTHLLLDECAFQDEKVWNEVLQPTLAVRGKRTLMVSTPKGKNFFYKMYIKGQRTKQVKSYKLTFKDNPFADLEFIEQRRKDLIEEVFDQEYLAEFCDQASVFKNVENLAILYKSKPSGQECVIGIDIAFQQDFTVAVCIDKHGNMLDYIRFNRLETAAAVDELYNFIKTWKPKKTLIENNNQGLPVFHLLKDKGVKHLVEFNTNGATKPELINQLIAAFGNNEIKILNDDIIKEELKAFTYYNTATGKVQFESAYGHDDVVIAMAIAWEAKKKYSVYNLIIRR